MEPTTHSCTASQRAAANADSPPPSNQLFGRASDWLSRLGPQGVWGRLALCLLTATAPLLALLFAVISADANRIMANAEWQAEEAARLGAEEQRSMLQGAAALLRALARVPLVHDADPACSEFLAGVVGNVAHVSSLSVADARGMTLCSSRPAGLGLSHADRSYFREAMALPPGASYALGAVLPSRLDGKPIMFMSVPLEPATPGGPARGVLSAALQLDWFAGLRAHVSSGQAVSVQVIDSRDGAVLARSPDPTKLAGLRLPDHPVVQAFRSSGSSGTITTADFDGVGRVFGFAALPGESPDLLIAVGLSAEALHADAERRMLLAMTIGLGVTGMAVLLSWWLAQVNLVRPLRAVSAAAGQLGSGDLSCTADIARSAPWEIQALAGTFRRMVSRLQLRDRRIEAMQLELAESEEHHRLLAESANDMITRFSADMTRLYVSPACRDILGYEPAELIGRKPGGIVHPDDWEELDGTLNQRLLAGYPTARATYRAFRKDGTPVWLESSGRRIGGGQGFVVVTRDVTECKLLEQQLETANEKLVELARLDALTGLANRRCFDEFLDREFRRAARDGTPLAVILLDVDQFKSFNDTYGHPAGDLCLQAIGAAVQACVRRPPDVAARYGGEEFAVLLPGQAEAGALHVARKIQQRIAEASVAHAGSSCGRVTSSMGVAVTLPQPGATFASLIERADKALYQAKRDGRDQVCLANEEAFAS